MKQTLRVIAIHLPCSQHLPDMIATLTSVGPGTFENCGHIAG